MLSVLMGAIAALIGLNGVTEVVPAQAQPKDQFELPLWLTGAGVASEAVAMTPQSDFKFRHIVRQAYDYSCGSAALVTLLNHHIGLAVDERAAMEGMLEKGEKDKIVARRGFSLLDMKRYVNSLGIDGNGYRAEFHELEELNAPGIVPIDYGGFKHFVVFRGSRDGKVFLADPSAGHLVLSQHDFIKLWDRNTIFVVARRDGAKPVAQLALTDRELGVMDPDRVRDGVSFDNGMALQRAIQSQQGVWFRR